MNISRAALELSVVPETLPAEAVYTLCPVLVASHIAVHQGWVDAELAKVGARARYLWSLPSEQWPSHFNHTLPNQFRDGGSIPAIHARSEGMQTRLDVALWADPTFLEEALAGRALS